MKNRILIIFCLLCLKSSLYSQTLTFFPNEMSFSQPKVVRPGQGTSLDSFRIYNGTGKPRIFQRIRILNGSSVTGELSLSTTNPTTPFVLSANEQQYIKVNFRPSQDIGVHIDTVFVVFSVEGRMDSIKIPFRIPVLRNRFISEREGPWNSPQTWGERILPSQNDTVEVLHNVTLGQDRTVNRIILKNDTLKIGSQNLTVEDIQAEGDNGAIQTQPGGTLSINNPRGSLSLPAQIKALHNLAFSGTIALSSSLIIAEQISSIGSLPATLNKNGFGLFVLQSPVRSNVNILPSLSNIPTYEIVRITSRTSASIRVSIQDNPLHGVSLRATLTDSQSNLYSGSVLQEPVGSADSVDFSFDNLPLDQALNIQLQLSISGIQISYQQESVVIPSVRKSVREGLWQEESTWEYFAVPTILDTVEIEHNVTMNAYASAAKVVLRDTLRTQGFILQITDDITVIPSLIGSPFITESGGGLSWRLNGADRMLPRQINVVHNLTLSEGGSLTLQDSLIVPESLITEGDATVMRGEHSLWNGTQNARVNPSIEVSYRDVLISASNEVSITAHHNLLNKIPNATDEKWLRMSTYRDFSRSIVSGFSQAGTVEEDTVRQTLQGAEGKTYYVQLQLRVDQYTISYQKVQRVQLVARTARPGRWSDPSTWESGQVPPRGVNVEIQSGHDITMNVDAVVGDLILNALLNFRDKSLTVYGEMQLQQNGEINGMSGQNGYKLVVGSGVGSSQEVFNLPAQITQLNKLVVERITGVRLSSSLTILDTLSLLRGSLDLQDNELILYGYFLANAPNTITGTIGQSGYKLTISGIGRTLELPSAIAFLNKFQVDRDNGVSLSNGLVVFDSLIIGNNRRQLISLNRDAFDVLYHPNTYKQINDGRIVPAVENLASTASGGSVFLQNTNLSLGQQSQTINVSTLTLEAWIRPVLFPDPTNTGDIVTKMSGGIGYTFGVTTDSAVLFTASLSDGRTLVVDTRERFTLRSGNWYHVAFTYDQAIGKIYINGALVSQVELVGTITSTQAPCFIGSTNASSSFRGEIDELRLWSQSRSQSEIKATMNSELTGLEESMIFYFKMNEGEGRTIYDYSEFLLHAVSTGNLEWRKSDARIATFLSENVQEQKFIPQQGAAREVQLLSTLKQLIIVGDGVSMPEFLVRYQSSPSREVSIPEGLDSIKQSYGYWKIYRQSTNVQMNNVVFKILYRVLDLTGINEQRLTWLYRKASTSPWTALGNAGSSDTLKSVIPLSSLTGYTELAIGITKPQVATIRNGLWSSPSTWQNNSIPLPSDIVIVRHSNVTLDMNTEIYGLVVENTGTIDLSTSTLRLTDSLNVLGQGRVIPSSSTVILQDNSQNPKQFRFPNRSLEFYKLAINKKSGCRVLNELTVVDDLFLQQGILEASGVTLNIEGTLTIGSGTVSGEFYRVNIFGQVNDTLFWPNQLPVVSNLTVNRIIRLNSSIIIRDTLTIGQNASIIRNPLNNILAAYTTNNINRITPPLEASTSYAGKALLFSGNSIEKIVIPITQDYIKNIKSSFTVEAWIRPDRFPFNSSIAGRITPTHGWLLKIDQNRQLRFIQNTTQGEEEIVGENFSMVPGDWYHVAASVNPFGAGIYINGVLVGSKSFNGTPVSESGNFYIGGIYESGQVFSGAIDEVRVWNKALSAEEIISTMNASIYNESLLAHFRLDEGNGTEIYDYSSSLLKGVFGTPTSATWIKSEARIATHVPSNSEAVQAHSVPPTGSELAIEGRGPQRTVWTMSYEPVSKGNTNNNLEIFYYQNDPVQLGPLAQGIMGIKNVGYWEVWLPDLEPILANAVFRVPLANLTFENPEEKKQLAILIRKSSAAPWEVVNGNVVGIAPLDTFITTSPIIISGTTEIAIGITQPHRFVFKSIVFSKNSTDVTINAKVINTLPDLPYSAMIEISDTTAFTQGSRTVVIPFFNLIEPDYNIEREVFGLKSDKDYFIRFTIKAGDVIQPETNLITFTTKTFSSSEVPETKETYLPEFTNSRTINIGTRKGRLDSLKLEYERAINPSSIVTVRHSTLPINQKGYNNIGASIGYYWSIVGNGIELVKGRLFYPLRIIYEDAKDSVNIRWYRRSSSNEEWQDFSDTADPIVVINGEKYLQTQTLNGFSDFIIITKYNDPEVITYHDLAITHPLSLSEKVQANVAVDINTGYYSNINSRLLVSSKRNLYDALIFDLNGNINNYPRNQTINFSLNQLERSTTYYFTAEIQHSNEGWLTVGDTAWFSTDYTAYEKYFSVIKGFYNIAARTPIQLGELFIEGQVSSPPSKSLFQVYLRESFSKLSELAITQDGIEFSMNPIYWTIVPAVYNLDGKLVPQRLLGFNGDRSNLVANTGKIAVKKSFFPPDVDFSNIFFLYRKDINEDWLNLGGAIKKLDDQLFFISEKNISSPYGQYTIAIKNKKYNQLPASIKEFDIVPIGKQKAIISWYAEQEYGAAGYELTRIDTLFEKVVQSFKTNPSLVGSSQTVIPKIYKVFDEGLEYGNTYYYKLRIHGDDGGIYEYPQLVKVTMPRRPSEDPIFKNSLNQCFPNPTSETTRITYSLAQESHVNLDIYDILGRNVVSVVDKHQPQGEKEIIFNVSKLSSGVYFCVMKINGKRTGSPKKIFVIR